MLPSNIFCITGCFPSVIFQSNGCDIHTAHSDGLFHRKHIVVGIFAAFSRQQLLNVACVECSIQIWSICDFTPWSFRRFGTLVVDSSWILKTKNSNFMFKCQKVLSKILEATNLCIENGWMKLKILGQKIISFYFQTPRKFFSKTTTPSSDPLVNHLQGLGMTSFCKTLHRHHYIALNERYRVFFI